MVNGHTVCYWTHNWHRELHQMVCFSSLFSLRGITLTLNVAALFSTVWSFALQLPL